MSKSRERLTRRLENAIARNETTLNLGSNHLYEIPPEVFEMRALTTLLLQYNHISILPPQLASLPSLTNLDISNNPITSPPPEILRQGTQPILQFLKARLEHTTRQWVSKLLVVGEGGVGKTQLLRHLRGENFDPHIPTTHGIEIHSCSLQHPIEKSVQMRLNSWDFGGQQIYHATHQFFLTNRSLFLLVWNARLGYEQGKLFYWLDTIQALAPDSPVLLVATHVDERDADLPLKDLQAKYRQLTGQARISNSLGDGIPELRNRVASLAARLPLMGEQWPSSWLAAAEELRGYSEKFVRPETMRGVMIRNRVAPEGASVLAAWLHELGDILFYPDDEELAEIVLLKPQWVSSYISRVLDDDEVAQKNGVFTADILTRLWYDLPTEMQMHFLRLMERFDLSYRTLEDRDVSLIVERLPLNAPDYEKQWNDFGIQPGNTRISMRFRLSTIPAGIPTWFIARSHRFTTYTHWRTGAMFADGHESRHLALVRSFPHDKYVDLTVIGPNPQEFFALLRDGFELTLARFPGLNIRRVMPCPGHDGKSCNHEFAHQHLLAATQRKPPVMEIQCPASFEMTSIPEMLFGIHWSTQGLVIKRIDEMEGRLRGEMDELRKLLQREFLKAYRTEQSKIESHCPSVFALRPTSDSGWKSLLVGQTFCLQLYCQAPGGWHPTDESGLYHLKCTAAWIEALTPYLRALIKIFKVTVPFAGPILGLIDEEMLNTMKHDVKLMEEFAKALPEKPDGEAANYAVDVTESAAPEIGSGAYLREIRAILQGADPQQGWGRLHKVLTPEGHFLWVCEKHARVYAR